MSKTLADMTPEQRAECVGMWTQVKGSRGKFESSAESYLAIIYHVHTPDTDVHETMVLAVGHGVMTVDPRNVTPRPDLNRAWNPDGTPPAGEWEYDVLSEDDAANLTGKEVVDRRWTGEWEEA